VKVAVLPLSRNADLSPKAAIWPRLAALTPTSTTPARSPRTAQDEIGTPYCVTIDFDTLNDKAVTVRDRDT